MFLEHIVFLSNEEGRKQEGEEGFMELETITTREMTSNIRLGRRWCVIISSFGKDVVVAQDSMTMDDARHPTRDKISWEKKLLPVCLEFLIQRLFSFFLSLSADHVVLLHQRKDRHHEKEMTTSSEASEKKERQLDELSRRREGSREDHW